MAQQQHQDTPTIGFRSFQLLKAQTLGIGSYGSVCKALCDDLLCAAKIIHPTLIDPNAHQRIERQREHRLPISRFMQECEFMSAIRHPNIVQYLGTRQDPQTGLPVLLMELMDDSLTHFLESSQDAIPYHIQVNFCHDITKAISYLHSNGITHRDLSSNNVLLCGNVKAKVTDFGMAKLGDINPQATRVSFTMCPGTDAYMPPEAVKDPPIYTAKIDCFAIGTLIIQILTRCFPEPGDRLKIVHTTDPQFPGGTVEVRASEIERRQNHISQVDPNHPLLPIALHSLKDIDVERLSARELCHRVAALKETPQFTESVRRAQERPEPGNTTKREEEIGELQQEKDDIIRAKNDIIQDKDQLIEERERHLQHVTQQLESSQQTAALFQTRIQELEQWFSDTSTRAVTRDSFTLRWREAKKAPCGMHRGSNCTVHGDMVYLRAASTRNIYAYKSTDETWDQLPEFETGLCSLAVVNNHLTTIGGRDSGGKMTNQLFSLIGEGRSKTWREVFQSMPTKRSSSVAMCTGQALIVVGGVSQHLKTLRTVEVMDIDAKEWSSAADLPGPLSEASITICHSRIYIIGGWNGEPIKSVYTCTLTDLFQSCRSRSLGERLAQSLSLSSPARSNVWNKVADLPVIRSTCVTVHDQLLAIGGYDSKGTPTSDVHIYHPTSNTWEVISKMIISRWCCFAAVLPTNELMVVGGYTTSSMFSKTDSVEIATVV